MGVLVLDNLEQVADSRRDWSERFETEALTSTCS